MKSLKLFFLFIFFIVNISFAQKTIVSDSAKSFLGQEVIVKGMVTQVSISKSGTVYFNIDGRYPENKISGVIYKKDVEKFGDLKYWEGKFIGIHGKIEEYKGSLEIILKNQGQLKFYD